jgi:hypothetical protein
MKRRKRSGAAAHRPVVPQPHGGALRPFVKGETGNAGGRTRASVISDALHVLLGTAGGGEDAGTLADRLAAVLVSRAESGDLAALKEILGRTEGRWLLGKEARGSGPDGFRFITYAPRPDRSAQANRIEQLERLLVASGVQVPPCPELDPAYVVDQRAKDEARRSLAGVDSSSDAPSGPDAAAELRRDRAAARMAADREPAQPARVHAGEAARGSGPSAGTGRSDGPAPGRGGERRARRPFHLSARGKAGLADRRKERS